MFYYHLRMLENKDACDPEYCEVCSPINPKHCTTCRPGYTLIYSTFCLDSENEDAESSNAIYFYSFCCVCCFACCGICRFASYLGEVDDRRRIGRNFFSVNPAQA